MENITDLLSQLDSLFNGTFASCEYVNPHSGVCVKIADFQERIHRYLVPKWYEVLFMLLFGVIFLVGLLGNFLVCFVIWRERRMRTITNTFIFNLAFADFMVLLIVLPFTVIQDVFESWLLGDVMCKVIKYIQVRQFATSFDFRYIGKAVPKT